MRWMTWGAALLCGLGTGSAQAGLFEGCRDDYSNCVHAGPACYAPAQPYYAPAGCGTMPCPPYSACGPGYDNRGCLERAFDKAWELETRKNNWLMRTFFGCGDDGYDYGYPNSVYYGYPAAGCNCN